MQAAADGAAARQALGNVFPLHARAPELDNQHVFLGLPFGLFLGRRRVRVRGAGRAAFAREAGRGRQGRQRGERSMGASVRLAVKIGRRGGGRELRGGGRGGRRDQGRVRGRGRDGDGPRQRRRRGGGARRRGRRTGLEDVGEVQLGGWKDKRRLRCVQHVRDGGGGERW